MFISLCIQVEVSASNDAELTLWDGWVGSRIRTLVKAVEDHANVRPFPKPKVPKVADPDGKPRK